MCIRVLKGYEKAYGTNYPRVSVVISNLTLLNGARK